MMKIITMMQIATKRIKKAIIIKIKAKLKLMMKILMTMIILIQVIGKKRGTLIRDLILNLIVQQTKLLLI